MDAFDLMLRDLRELHVFSVVVLGLPVASVVLLAMRRWLVVVPLAVSAALGVIWFLYYARDWPNPGIAGFWPGFLALLAGWIALGIAKTWHRYRQRAEDEPSPESLGRR